ncbi:MAG: hypothetical protein A2Z91_06285 [Deltaproteobacteria bacterium GWA2_38_16]|nr:MAG: hypothetical protein A2Z91_06285 [Deltaproteobacteria bacterium GWA2_38_16]OGQ03692.1 MAG: hypothetical protein A3D19_02495 [Deltaproteobacteria bacterium RIFCSPHIGHO2_02_FULL_38_15]
MITHKKYHYFFFLSLAAIFLFNSCGGKGGGGGGDTSSQSSTIEGTIPASPQPQVTIQGPSDFDPNTDTEFKAVVLHMTAPLMIQWSEVEQNSAISFNPGTHSVSDLATPIVTQVKGTTGSYTLKVDVTDAQNKKASYEVSVQVNQALHQNSLPTISNFSSPTSVTEGEEISVTFDAQDPDSEDTLSYQIQMSDATTSLEGTHTPQDAINSTGHVIHKIQFETAKTYGPFKITVSDDKGGKASQEFTIVVQAQKLCTPHDFNTPLYTFTLDSSKPEISISSVIPMNDYFIVFLKGGYTAIGDFIPSKILKWVPEGNTIIEKDIRKGFTVAGGYTGCFSDMGRAYYSYNTAAFPSDKKHALISEKSNHLFCTAITGDGINSAHYIYDVNDIFEGGIPTNAKWYSVNDTGIVGAISNIEINDPPFIKKNNNTLLTIKQIRDDWKIFDHFEVYQINTTQHSDNLHNKWIGAAFYKSLPKNLTFPDGQYVISAEGQNNFGVDYGWLHPIFLADSRYIAAIYTYKTSVYNDIKQRDKRIVILVDQDGQSEYQVLRFSDKIKTASELNLVTKANDNRLFKITNMNFIPPDKLLIQLTNFVSTNGGIAIKIFRDMNPQNTIISKVVEEKTILGISGNATKNVVTEENQMFAFLGTNEANILKNDFNNLYMSSEERSTFPWTNKILMVLDTNTDKRKFFPIHPMSYVFYRSDVLKYSFSSSEGIAIWTEDNIKLFPYLDNQCK